MQLIKRPLSELVNIKTDQKTTRLLIKTNRSYAKNNSYYRFYCETEIIARFSRTFNSCLYTLNLLISMRNKNIKIRAYQIKTLETN